MEKRGKILIGIGVFLSIIIGVYYLMIPMIIGSILTSGPRNPKLEIAEIYNIGWWRYQDSLTIDSLFVEFEESRLNLFNNKSLIKYVVKGRMIGRKHYKPIIENIHISQRFLNQYNSKLNYNLNTDSTKIIEAIIEITPIVKTLEDDFYNGDEVEFEFTNELKLQSFHWGNNYVRFQCADKFQDLILKQHK